MEREDREEQKKRRYLYKERNARTCTCLLQNCTSPILEHVVIRRRIFDMRACAVEKDMFSTAFEFALTHKPAQREQCRCLYGFGSPREREREGQKKRDIK
jgi:hypothetical protein